MTDKPTGCLNPKPNAISILFAGEYICLSAIARLQGIDLTYLSRIFSGERYPQIRMARKIAVALGMDVDSFCRALDDRLKLREAGANKRVQNYKERIRLEEEEDRCTLAHGRIPLPRNPGLYDPRDVR